MANMKGNLKLSYAENHQSCWKDAEEISVAFEYSRLFSPLAACPAWDVSPGENIYI